jgi:hypothetical protein
LYSSGVTNAAASRNEPFPNRIVSIRREAPVNAPSARPNIFKPAPPPLPQSENALDHRLAEEIDCIVRRLELVGGALVDDPLVLHRHGVTLQSIDLVNQLLRHLSRVVVAADKEAAVDRIGMVDLKARLTRKPVQPICSK